MIKMIKRKMMLNLLAVVLLVCLPVAGFAASPAKQKYTLENAAISRTLSIENGHLVTVELNNKLSGKRLMPIQCDEFRLRISEGTDTTGTDKLLTSVDFKAISAKEYAVNGGGSGIKFDLRNDEYDLGIVVSYELQDSDFYMRKKLQVRSGKEITIERFDIEAISFEDAYQPYTTRQIAATRDGGMGWRPGLGQPLYTKISGTFWGVEFPASDNFVEKKNIICGYLYGHKLVPGQIYASYKAVVGCSDDARYNSDAFYKYINRIRIRPVRLQLQYNSWFEYGARITREQVIAAGNKLNQELTVKRGVKPINAIVIDDAWHASFGGGRADWSDKVWKVCDKFDPDFATTQAGLKKANTSLGLWLSPMCWFGSKGIVDNLRANKMGALKRYMSMANTPYMDLLEKRMVELTAQGITFFKLDGTFGAATREFELNGRHGVPAMPQLNTKDFTADDPRLNDSKYDELKIYYLTVGTERLMKTFKAMAGANPDVYIVLSNGGYLSAWWLMYCDTVWMINAGDSSGNQPRSHQLMIRDAVYHEIWLKENTQFPMCSLFNHEPAKKKTGESEEEFRKYMFMSFSRGTAFAEMYLGTVVLSERDWDVIAESILWLEEMFPTLTNVHMHGGVPHRRQVYGYSAWDSKQGYISIHNPNRKKTYTYTIKLDRDIGLLPTNETLYTSSPLPGSLQGVNESYKYGDEISVEVGPEQVRIINFGVKKNEWKKIKDIQNKK